MLQDYREYIINLRNNLIQCGVNVPINPLEDYKEIFFEADKLSQILWFYSIMNISGSELAIPEFFIPLDSYYKEKMRKVIFQEFQEYLKEYKGLSKLALLSGEESYIFSENVDIIGSDNEEEIPLFTNESVEYNEEDILEVEPSDNDTKDDTEFSEFTIPVEYNTITEREIHGTFLEEVVEENFNKMLLEPNIAEYAEHGTFLDDIEVDEYSRSFISESEKNIDYSCSDVVHGVYLDIEDREESSNESEVHGIFLDDYVERVNTGVEESIDSDIHGIFLDDIVVEEDEYIEPEVEYDENGFEIVYEDEEESNQEEDFDEYPEYEGYEDNVEYDENGFEIVYEEENEGSIVDEDEWFKPEIPSQPTSNTNNGNITQGTVRTTNTGEEDLSDLLQNGVNNILTMGKRFLVREQQKLRDMEKK